MHKQVHRHAARRLHKRDDTPAINVDFLEEREHETDALEKKAKVDEDSIATVYSLVYVTASASFTGPTAGYVTLSPDTTTSSEKAKATKQTTSDDEESTKSTARAKTTSSKTTSKSSVKSTSESTTSSKSSKSSGSSSESSRSMGSSTTLATSSVAASSSSSITATTALLAEASSSSSATASSSAAADSSSGGMSGGAKAGVAFGIILALGLIAGATYFFIRKKKAQQKSGGMEKLVDEKKSYPSNPPIPQPPPSSLTARAAPRVSYRPGSQFAPKILGDAEKAAAGAAGASLIAANNDRPASAGEGRPATATTDPSNPFGIHAQTVDAQPKDAPTKDGRPLSPPVELQGSPVESPTQANFDPNSPNTSSNPPAPIAKPGVSTASAIAVAAGAVAAPGPQQNVHRVQLEFKPSMEDELELKVGQIVRMLHEYDDGWALCIRMDRSQQGVAPRTCLSKLPLKPRPVGPPNGSPNAPPHGPPRGNGPPRGPPRSPPGANPNGRQVGPPPAGQANRNFTDPSNRQNSMIPQPLSPSMSAVPTAQNPQSRSRSMSVASPNRVPLQAPASVPSPTRPVHDAHRRSISMGSLGNGPKPPNGQAGPSLLGIPTRKPVPGQAL